MSSVRDAARPWVLTVTIVGALIAVVAALGGFERSTHGSARTVSQGETIELTRWDVVVEGCTYTPPASDADDAATVQIRALVTNTSDETLSALNPETLIVHLPNGQSAGGRSETYVVHENLDAGGGFDPHIPTNSMFSVKVSPEGWPAEAGEVELRFASEYQREGFIMAGAWTANVERANVTLSCGAEQPW